MNIDNIKQSILNIGTLGHIDHGKTSITKAITNQWTDKHSESIKRNMTIKLGYADSIINKCDDCIGPEAYTINEKCGCNKIAKPLLKISILDAPGHETLMATAIAGSNVIDAILFIIAANEPCPMQQTKEHLMIINILGIRNIIIIQTKIDLVGKDKAIKHYNQIKDFIKGSVIEDAPIVPVMTNQNINIDVLLEKIANFKIPERDLKSDPIMYVVRSFDVNKPGAKIETLSGGVIGCAITKGIFNVGDEIEISPGIKIETKKEKNKITYKPIITKIVHMYSGNISLEKAQPGGLIGIATQVDPTFTKADNLVGNIVGHPNKIPALVDEINIKFFKINRSDIPYSIFKENEALILGVGTATLIGYVKNIKKDTVNITLKHSACIEKSSKIAVMRNILQRWRLVGYGLLI